MKLLAMAILFGWAYLGYLMVMHLDDKNEDGYFKTNWYGIIFLCLAPFMSLCAFLVK